MVAPLVGLAVGAAARAVAKKVASNAVKKAATKKLVKEAAKKKPLATPKSAVKVKYNKQAMENAIKDSQLKMKRPDMSPSRPVVSPPGSGRAVKINSGVKVKPASRPTANNPDSAKLKYKSEMKNTRMINTGVPSSARPAAGVGRKTRIQANKLKAK
jgi:hypothetical protein